MYCFKTWTQSDCIFLCSGVDGIRATGKTRQSAIIGVETPNSAPCPAPCPAHDTNDTATLRGTHHCNLYGL